MNTLTLPLTRHLWGALVALLAFAGFLITAPAAHAEMAFAEGWIWGGGADNFEGTGWFSMNSANVNDTSPDSGNGSYGVKIPLGDGDITGYAWSEHYGWLSFEEDMHSVAACSGKGNARRVGNTIVGAAIIVASAGSGGYDGCVVFDHLKGSVTVDPATGQLDGYAYSNEYGWLHFSKVALVAGKSGKITGMDCEVPEGQSSCPPPISWEVNDVVTKAQLLDDRGNKYSLDIDSSQTGTVTNTVPLFRNQTNTYKLQGESVFEPLMSDIMTGITVRPTCSAPKMWQSDGVCKTPAATGDIKVEDATNTDVTASPDCTIPVNGTSCSRKVSWTSANATAPSIKRNGVILSNSASGTLSPNPTFDGGSAAVTYAVYDGLSPLKTVQIKGVCETGSSWQTGSCKPNVVPEGWIDPETCEVPIGEKLCTATVYYETNSEVSTPRFYRTIEGGEQELVGWLPSGSNEVTLTMKADGTGERAVYELYNGATTTENRLAGPTTVTATCVSGAEYSPTTGKCEATTVVAELIGDSTCTILAGASTCASVPFTWTISGSFDKATVRANILPAPTYSDQLELGSGSVPSTANGAANFVNVVGWGPTGKVDFQVAYWKPGETSPTMVGNTITVEGSCATGSSWNGTICESTGPSGVLTVAPKNPPYTTCQNLSNDSTKCIARITWDTDFTAAPLTLKRRHNSGGTWQIVNNSMLEDGTLDNELTEPGTYFYQLFDSSNAQIDVEKSIVMSCASGLWNGSQCVGAGYAAVQLLDASSNPTTVTCDIDLNASSCTVKVRWTVSYVQSPTLYLTKLETTNEVIDMLAGASSGEDFNSSIVSSPVTFKFGDNIFHVNDFTNNPVRIDTDGDGVADADSIPFNVKCANPGQYNHAEGKCTLGGPQ